MIKSVLVVISVIILSTPGWSREFFNRDIELNITLDTYKDSTVLGFFKGVMHFSDDKKFCKIEFGIEVTLLEVDCEIWVLHGVTRIIVNKNDLLLLNVPGRFILPINEQEEASSEDTNRFPIFEIPYVNASTQRVFRKRNSEDFEQFRYQILDSNLILKQLQYHSHDPSESIHIATRLGFVKDVGGNLPFCGECEVPTIDSPIVNMDRFY